MNFKGGLRRPLKSKTGGPHQGIIILKSEEIINSRDFFEFQFQVDGLPTGFFAKNHFLEIRRADENGEFRLVRRTRQKSGKSINEVIRISGQDLNNGDNERTLKFKLYHYKGSGSHKLLGEFQSSTNELSQSDQSKTYNFKNTKSSLSVIRCLVHQKYTFLDYLQGGMSMNFVVAIDFTASNGDPNDPNSLHFISNPNPNQYVQAIKAVGDIIEDYDSDKVLNSNFNNEKLYRNASQNINKTKNRN